MTIWFTSDPHYYHAKVIQYSRRPFKTVEEMNETLIANCNSKVKSGDTLYCLGDFGFADQDKLKIIVHRLNGDKHLILGNHDRYKKMFGIGWNSIQQYLEIKVPDENPLSGFAGFQHIALFHYSLRVWNKSHYGAWQAYGHSHGTLYDDPNLLSTDVGVDPCNFFPISYEELKEKMKKKTWKPIEKRKIDSEL